MEAKIRPLRHIRGGLICIQQARSALVTCAGNIAEGEDRPTSDPDVATRLVAQRLEELENARKRLSNPQLTFANRVPLELAEYAKRHLELKGDSERYDEDWMKHVQMHLETACDLLGARTLLPTITVAEISDKFLRVSVGGLHGATAASAASRDP